MSRSWSPRRAPRAVPIAHRGAWSAPVAVGADRPRFFGRRSLALVAGGAVGGALLMSGAVVTGALVGIGSLIAAPFVGR